MFLRRTADKLDVDPQKDVIVKYQMHGVHRASRKESGMKSIVSMLRSLVRIATESFDRPETTSDRTMSKFIGLL